MRIRKCKQVVKKFIPTPLKQVLWHLIYQWTPEVVWRYHPISLISRKRLKKFWNLHEGKTCFIIGNGPSLNKMDLSLLRDQFTFGLNRIYLLFPKIGFTTTYLVSVNKLVLEQCANEISDLSIPKFISWYSRKNFRFSLNTYYIRDSYDNTLAFAKNPKYRIWEGATVTYVAIQLAYYMGFQRVILIGLDHNFITKGKAHIVIVTKDYDPNHFDPNYFSKGFRWQLPDLDASEKAYQIARDVFEKDGREILDATIGGNLQVFPKINYKSLF